MRTIAFRSIIALCFCGLAACVVEDDVETEDLVEVEDDLDGPESLAGGPATQAKKKPKCNDPAREYVSHDPDECALIHFFCPEGEEPFFDNCGCGCQPSAGEACGANTCAADQVCCNASCGICTAPGDFCTQQVCEPVPG